MSRVASAVLFACLLLAGAIPSSAVAMKSLGSVDVPATSSGVEIAFDESFVYWVGKAAPVDGDPLRRDDDVVMRKAFSGGPATELYRVRAADSDHIGRLEVGGGLVAIDIHRGANDDFGDGTTRIVRFASDGSNPVELASGVFTLDRDQYKNSGSLDCGSVVQLNDVSSSGDVYYVHNQRLRKTAPCSNGKNVNYWQHFRVRPDGSRSQFYSTSAAASGSLSDGDGPLSTENSAFECDCAELGQREIRAAGDWALVISEKRLTLVNVATGNRTNGYKPAHRFANSMEATLDSTGRVILETAVAYGESSWTSRARLYRKPGSLRFVTLKGSRFHEFCGDRLLAFRGRTTGRMSIFDRGSGGRLARKRTGSFSLSRTEGVFGCTATTVVRMRIQRKKFHLSALALPSAP